MISQMFTLISFSVLQISRHDIFFFLSIGFPCCIECECLVRVCVCLCIQMNMPVKLRVFVVCFHKDFSIVLYKANKKKKKKKRSGSGIRLFTIRKCLMHTRCDLHCFWILEWILLIFFLFKSLFSKYKYFHHCCYFIWICCFFFLPFFFFICIILPFGFDFSGLPWSFCCSPRIGVCIGFAKDEWQKDMQFIW